jgi:hypothetical protein
VSCQGPIRGNGCSLRSQRNSVVSDRRTLRTTFRETLSSRRIALIVFL